MHEHVFLELRRHFRSAGWLQNSQYVFVEEKMVMFLIHNVKKRLVKRRFNHSFETLPFYFHEVLQAVLNFSKEMFTQPSYSKFESNPNSFTTKEIFEVTFG